MYLSSISSEIVLVLSVYEQFKLLLVAPVLSLLMPNYQVLACECSKTLFCVEIRCSIQLGNYLKLCFV